MIFEAEKTYMVIQLINGPDRVSQWAFGKVEKALIQWGLKKCSITREKQPYSSCDFWDEGAPNLILALSFFSLINQQEKLD